jgi:eukaryotic-like serine/threonine-protein kinase
VQRTGDGGSGLSRVRLGEFEVDLVSGELRPVDQKSTADRVILREQPFQVLRLLIERDGKILTRDEIKKKLWPNDTIVDFGHSINVAIGTLRRALADSADNPRYIETLARRGYRLLPKPEWLDSSVEPPRKPSSPLPPPGPHGLLGQRVSHYRVMEIIGMGGMGMVYKAEDLKLGRRVALKFLPEELASEPLALKRLEREARTASSLNHPNICTIHAIDEFEGQPFIVMELLEGETLLDRMTAIGGAMPLPSVLHIGIQACEGLRAAHGRGVIHRDIKPANIFLTKEGRVKILDFGLAKVASAEEAAPLPPPDAGGESLATERPASLTHTGAKAGTARYMSPEQVRGEPLDIRTDVFSLGAVLYEMVTGQNPFQGETVDAVHDAILHQPPPSIQTLNASAPRSLDVVLQKMLRKDRAQRYPSASEVQSDLARIERAARPAGHGLRHGLMAAALLAVVVAGIGYYGQIRSRVTLSPNDTIVLADMANRTSDPIFDTALNTALRCSLEQTPYLNVLRLDKVIGALAQLHRPPTTSLPLDLARQVCRKTHSKMVVAGSIADDGNRFALELRALDGPSGDVVARVRSEVDDRTQIVHTLGVLAAKLRRKLGEPPGHIARFNRPQELATSSSLEALQVATAGFQRHIAGDPRGAIPYYERAIALDPEFALVHATLGAAHENDRDYPSMVADETRAYQLRDRLSEPYRSQTEYLFYMDVQCDDAKAESVSICLVRTFPRDPIARNNWGVVLERRGQLVRSAEEYQEAARLQPNGFSYGHSARSSISAGQLSEAKATIQAANARHFDGLLLRHARLCLAFLENDQPTIEEQWRWAVGTPYAREFADMRAAVEAYRGRFRSARLWAQRASRPSNGTDGYPPGNPDEALREAEVGIPAHAMDHVQPRADMSPYRLLTVALALARAGRLDQAGKLADSIGGRFPVDGLIQRYHIPTVRAAIRLGANEPAGAVATLQATSGYEYSISIGFGNLYPAYVRGLAYLRLGRPRQAVAEFQKLVDHPYFVGWGVTGALANLQLGRAYRMAGDLDASRKSYERFLAIWKDADPDIPIYQDAKKEYAALLRARPTPS